MAVSVYSLNFIFFGVTSLAWQRFSHPGRAYKPEDVAIDPLVAPQPISLDGLTSKPPPVDVQPAPGAAALPKTSRRRRRR